MSAPPRCPDLLLEIGTEDLPARYVLPLADALCAGLQSGLARRGIAHGRAWRYATPRRLAVRIEAVAAEQPEQTQELIGPALSAALKDGQPTPAALGFARKCGVTFAELGEKDGKLCYQRRAPGQSLATLFQGLVDETLKGMDELVPKRMRWGEGEETFVRPVQWLLALHGDQVLPLLRFGCRAGRLSYGHRFHAPDALSLAQAADYPAALRAAEVWAEVEARRDEIRRQIEAEAARLGGHARITPELLDEVTALVEKPVAISGRFEARFLELPPEVIVATVETNQRYFTVFEDPAHQRLTAAFITVANIASREVRQVIEGNERVVRPRLTDALFFWQQDLKQPLAAYGEKLASSTYQKELGTQAARVARLSALAARLATRLQADGAAVSRAAALCKNDLVTKMVFEFPELQGLMGGYYAARAGEPAAVAQAIREHYRPTQQGTPIPSSREGQILALADKLDALAGIFAIGQKPSASKDPYALRRAALGVLRILIEGGLALDLRDLLQAALEAQPAGQRDAATLEALLDFVLERQRGYLLGPGISSEMIEAVRALGITVPLDFQQRLHAVRDFSRLPEATALAAANKRVRNILRQAQFSGGQVQPGLLQDPAEQALQQALETLPAREPADYTPRLRDLAALREPIDAFFAAVMVNAEDPGLRANRLALLARFDARCREIADLSQLPG
ncbi:MAG TPA: glycine--tRNA ligase subunit beta [Nevskiaceae bacterium]|nr:glycine--tRNA ligase subunit beta [Nevskiaceae bacterium]